MSEPLYDDIGRGYATKRRPDPRIAAQIRAAIGDARTVLNIGAGTGSYEPVDLEVTALEPSAVMRAQRPPSAAPCVEGVAGALPFADGSFDVAMTSLSLHHWPDQRAGLAEMQRVAPRQVVFCFEVGAGGTDFWLWEYVPEILDLPASVPLSPVEIADALGGGRIETVPVPHDCTDGFLSANWRRPTAYLDPAVRAATSGFAQLDPALVEERMGQLAADIESGAWAANHAALLEQTELDTGFRLVVT